MKKFLILAVVLLMMAPAAFGKNMVEGKFGAGLALGTGASLSQTDFGNQLGLGIVLQYGITGLTFQGYFNYHMPVAPKTQDDINGESQSLMDFGVNFLGTVGDGPFVAYAGLGFFYGMTSYTAGEDADEMTTSTLGLNLTAAMDYFLNDMIALGFQVTYPVSLSSTITMGGHDADYPGRANAAGMGYKVDCSFFF
jgi:hypothetical protein